VTEIHIQPAVDTPELRALGTNALSWIDDWKLATQDKEFAQIVANSGAVMIGYRELRNVMRAG
jgi:hypothetical protein